VGSYDIVMLSAKQSNGLVTWLKGEGYKLPDGAETAVSGYVDMGMKFFVARVNLSRHAADTAQKLEPLQLSFRSTDFMRPLQLGKLNGDGPQDLMFRETKDRDSFQGRYIMNHPFDGEITCPEAKQYVASLRLRLKDEAALLRKLTGWRQKEIRRNILATTPAGYH
ncbi:MAG: DUF2330 domain-containing protein, partial [Albidovulum sp.]